MRRASIGLVVTVIALAANNRILPAAEDTELTPEKVRTAIEGAVDYLKKSQMPDGSWTDMAAVNQAGGVTALATLALLNAGVPVEEPHVQKALSYLRQLKPERTYVTSLQTMVFCLAEPRKDALLIQRNAKWLEDSQILGGPRKGTWTYDVARRDSAGINGGMGDNSNTQFAILALHEAERQGVKIKPQTWQFSRDYWVKQQNLDGSWAYHEGQPGTGSMTCAGVACMVIAMGKLTAQDAKVTDDKIECCGSQTNNDAVERALDWLGRNFTVSQNPANGGRSSLWHLYYLYGLERVGRMTAHRFIGREDWYRRGAEYLISKQDVLGSWSGQGLAESDRNIATSLCLLFLAKGRRPVLMAKAHYGKGNDWNRHRSDVANLTSYVETEWKRDLVWQVVDLNTATADDLLQTPVLFLNGKSAPEVSDAQAKVLREYIDRGGFLLAEACCPDSSEFDEGFRSLMEKVFPEPEYKFKLLPPTHPIWNAEKTIAPNLQRKLLGIDYGCRTSVVYCPPAKNDDPPGNLSCYWEVATGHEVLFEKKIIDEVQSAKDIGLNILAYATNRVIPGKDETLPLSDKQTIKDEIARGKFYIAKIQHGGGSDAAPGALPNLLRAAGRELKMRVEVEQRMVSITDPQLFNYPLAFMHGRYRFKFSDKDRETLKQYLTKAEGTLFVDSICASREFAESFRDEMKIIFPDQLKPIPGDHKMYTKELGGFDVTSVSRREPVGKPDAPRAAVRKGPPELEGIKIGDRYAVIFSPYDLSCALEKHDSPECAGYTRDDAERIGLNVVLYSLNH